MTQASPSLQDLPSQYDHEAAQAKWYKVWEERGYFHAEAVSEKPPYCIVIPPPNVTGALHLGHALNNTLQDILIRMKRMQGFNALWMPGTDHAGIATQAVVERRLLEEEKLSRHKLGREGLVARIWKWKEQYEARIISQLKQLGCSCDWQRLRFTLDDQCARAVRETFFRLFKDGKIYRGKRLVNWDTFLQTAVSDDEVFHEAVKGSFWHFRYPVIKDDKYRAGDPEFVTIATTRPETMLGDTAVAVHPDPAAAFDKVGAELREKMLSAPAKEKGELEEQATLLLERRAKMLPQLERLRDMAQRGVMLELPLTGRTIPLIADEWAKPELGSGCVKITPAHDANDYAVWQRHAGEFGAINIMNPDGTIGEGVAEGKAVEEAIDNLIRQYERGESSSTKTLVPKAYHGKAMLDARRAVLLDLENLVIDGVRIYDPEIDREDREIELAHSDRSKKPIEPYLVEQWFVRMDKLAQSAIDAVRDGRVRIVPERYAKSYLDWLSEKRDWPVGRQLWWGHQIPIWYISVRYPEQNDDVTESDGDERRSVLDGPQGPTFEEVAANGLRRFKSLLVQSGFGNDEFALQEIVGHDEPAFYVCAKHADFEERLAKIDDPNDEFKAYREEEVLDTWFSSALWPHSTLGWPDQTPELATFYPTTALVTSRDIISLWVARMVLMGLYNMGDVPFHEVYITPKILDGYGETMSKSKGNGVDPIDVIDKFGADALRYGIAYLTTDTQDVKMPVEFECPHCQHLMAQTKKNRTLPRVDCEKCGQPFGTQWAEKAEDKALPRAGVSNERFELGRRFCNKLWNASRFSLMNLSDHKTGDVITGPIADADLMLEDRWLLSRLATVTREVTDALQSYRFADASRTLYAFAWNDFCDYYVEITKARFKEPAQRAVAQRVLAHVLDSLLRLLHPIVPFLTEEVWQLLNEVAPERGLVIATSATSGGNPSADDRTTALCSVATGDRARLLPSLRGRGSAESVCIAAWPTVDEARIDPTIEEQFADFQAVLGAVREIRLAQNIPPRTPIEFRVRTNAATAKLLEPMRPYFAQIAEATCTALGPAIPPPERAVTKSLGEIDVHVDVSAFFDAGAEKARLTKEIAQLRGFAESIDKKLANEGFVSRAPADVVQQQRAKREEVRAQLAAAEAALATLEP